jgi:hypothetical protein
MLQHVTGQAVPCPSIQLEVTEFVEGEPGGEPTTWMAAGCGKAWRCSLREGSASTGPAVLESCVER